MSLAEPDRTSNTSLVDANHLLKERCCGLARQLCPYPRAQLRPTRDTETAINGRPVFLHGGRADAANRSDVSARVALYIQNDQIALPWCQSMRSQQRAHGRFVADAHRRPGWRRTLAGGIAKISPCVVQARNRAARVSSSISKYSSVRIPYLETAASEGTSGRPRWPQHASARIHPIGETHVLADGRRAGWERCAVGMIDQPDLPAIVALRWEARDSGFPQHSP
jgi:hypothetical protein